MVVACDKFKGSLTAGQVLACIADGLRRADPDRRVETVVVADGGDGTLDAALSAGFERVPVTVDGPTGEPVETAYAVLDGWPSSRWPTPAASCGCPAASWRH